METESERYLDLIAARAVHLKSMAPTQALPAEQRASFIPSTVRRRGERGVAPQGSLPACRAARQLHPS